MKVIPCGKVRPKYVAERNVKPPSFYILRAKWDKVAVGTNTHYSASNSDFKVEICDGCFGKSTHITNIKTGKQTHQHYLHKDGSIEDWQERLEKQYLFPEPRELLIAR